MIEPGEMAPQFALDPPAGAPWLLVFLETDCPTCRLTLPYLNKLARSASVIGVSQDSECETRRFMEQTSVVFPVTVDRDLSVSRAYDPSTVPAFFLIGADGRVTKSTIGFDKDELNGLAADMGHGAIADPFDGAPARKPGCSSRHLEPVTAGEAAEPLNLHSAVGARATRIELDEDAHEYCMRYSVTLCPWFLQPSSEWNE